MTIKLPHQVQTLLESVSVEWALQQEEAWRTARPDLRDITAWQIALMKLAGEVKRMQSTKMEDVQHEWERYARRRFNSTELRKREAPNSHEYDDIIVDEAYLSFLAAKGCNRRTK